MSKKKNKNRQPSLLQDLSENERQASSNNEIGLAESDASIGKDAKTGIALYLKAHWWTVALVAFLTIGAFGATMKYLEDSARQNAADGKNANGEKDRSLLAKLNPFSSAPLPTTSPTPLPMSKEYIYAGSRLLAVEDANASAAPPADLAIWRPSSGAWWVMGGQGSQQVTQAWGQDGDEPVPGDYDGDGKTDFAIFRKDINTHLGYWYILYSATNSWTQIQWGQDSDIDNLTPADFDGDGRTDIALWRPSNGGWYILKSSDNQALSFTFGLSTDKPAPADYDGDGKADVAVWRNSTSTSTFYSINSSNSQSQTIGFSAPGDEPVCADYDGDGKADYAIRSGADWVIRKSSTGSFQNPVQSWQTASDVAVHNDYDGDGKVDIAVWRPSNGTWYILKSSNGQTRTEVWGTSGDIPVPAFYRR